MESKVITTKDEVLGAIAYCISSDPYKQVEWVEENRKTWGFSETVKGYSGNYCALPLFLILGFKYSNRKKELCFVTGAESMQEVQKSVLDAFEFDSEELDGVEVLMYQADKGFQKIDYNLGYYEPESCDCSNCQNKFAPELNYLEVNLNFEDIPDGCTPFVELPYIWEFEYGNRKNDETGLAYFEPEKEKFEIHKFKNVENAFNEAIATLFAESGMDRVKIRSRWFEFYIYVNLPEYKRERLGFDEFKEYIEIEGVRIVEEEEYW